MKKFVKVMMRGKKFIHLPMENWNSMLKDPNLLVAYRLDGEEEWQGRTLNKMEVVFSEYDKEYTESMNQPKFSLFRNKETNTVVKMLDGQLPDDVDKYEKVG